MADYTKQDIEDKFKQASKGKYLLIPIIGAVIGFSSLYTVDEGYVGIVKRLGEVKERVTPGLHFKRPFVDEIIHLEIRTKKNVETMSVATKEQMRADATISVNWTVKKEAVLDLYKQYGSLEQFEERVLDPRLREVSKQSISKYTAEENINAREVVTEAIKSEFLEKVSGLPVVVDSIQYENIELPQIYLTSINAKQTAKNERDAEQYKLEKQKLEAMRAVNTAEANKQSAQLEADGIAYKTKVEAEANAEKITVIAEAEAKAMKIKGDSLKSNPDLIEYQKAISWDGKLPQTVMGGNPGVLMNLK